VSARAAVFTVTKICRAAIVSGRRGRPLGLPDTPGLKLVERLPPRGIVWSRLLAGLFLADPASGLNRGDNRQVCATTRPV
jgi:hypothetical protein